MSLPSLVNTGLFTIFCKSSIFCSIGEVIYLKIYALHTI
jgi:hypothetical protein